MCAHWCLDHSRKEKNARPCVFQFFASNWWARGVSNTTDKLSLHITPRMCAEYRHLGSPGECVHNISSLETWRSMFTLLILCCHCSGQQHCSVSFWILGISDTGSEFTCLVYRHTAVQLCSSTAMQQAVHEARAPPFLCHTLSHIRMHTVYVWSNRILKGSTGVGRHQLRVIADDRPLGSYCRRLNDHRRRHWSHWSRSMGAISRRAGVIDSLTVTQEVSCSACS